MEFVWDSEKDSLNLARHGVSFEEAKTVFVDPSARRIFDPDHSESEDRFVLLGLSAKLRLLVVCHCYREETDEARIISARKATESEKKTYEGRKYAGRIRFFRRKK